MKTVDSSLTEFVRATQKSDAKPKGMYAAFGKRALDLLLCVFLLPLAAPIVAVLWLIIRRDGGSGFFGHERVGMNGERFRCWKLRSMCSDADQRLANYLANAPQARAEWDRDHKLTNDPRITRFGNFLRRSSLDELPQLWNVLRGEMSLVGPRPVVPAELVRYGTYAGSYLSVRPGVTGLWQVSGRNDVTYDERVQMDVAYASKMSAFKDLSLLCLTAGAVLKRTGK